MISETKVALTPAEIDDLCLAFDAAKIRVETEQQNLSVQKGDLLAAIRSQGYTPANAEKTTRLEGILYIADATEGSTVEIDEASVATLQSELSRLKHPRVFKDLFARKVKHSLKKNASGALRIAIAALPDDEQARLLGIFSGCFTVDTKAPSVKVNLAESLREKEAEAERKAAAKAATKPRAKK